MLQESHVSLYFFKLNVLAAALSLCFQQQALTRSALVSGVLSLFFGSFSIWCAFPVCSVLLGISSGNFLCAIVRRRAFSTQLELSPGRIGANLRAFASVYATRMHYIG
jgi:hypothetical protein